VLHKDRKPLNLDRIIVGEGIYGFLVETSRGLDAVAEVFKVLSELNLTLVHMAVPEPVSKRTKGSFMLFLDFTKSKMTPFEAKNALERRVSGIKIDIAEPVLSGVTVDSFHFPLMFLNERAVIFRETALKAWLINMRERFGTGGEAFLFHEGYIIGNSIYDACREMCGKECDIWTLFGAVLFASGIAENVSTDIGYERIIVKVWNNIECSLAKTKNLNKPFSHWLRGILAGFGSRYFGRRISAVEVKCIAKGDPYCEFIIT